MLFEFDAATAALEPGTSLEDAARGFPAGALVAVEGANPRILTVVEHEDGDPVPAGFCGDDAPRLVVSR